jgi:hypothetical protein
VGLNEGSYGIIIRVGYTVFAMLCVTVVLLFLVVLCEFSLVIGEKLLDIDDGVARGALPIIAPLTLLLIMTFLYVDYVESKRLEKLYGELTSSDKRRL